MRKKPHGVRLPSDHIAAGAKEGSTAQECAGSIILVQREMLHMCDENNAITPESLEGYLKARRDGLTKSGVQYWVIARHQFGGIPFLGGPKLPHVDMDEPGIGRVDREDEAC